MGWNWLKFLLNILINPINTWLQNFGPNWKNMNEVCLKKNNVCFKYIKMKWTIIKMKLFLWNWSKNKFKWRLRKQKNHREQELSSFTNLRNLSLSRYNKWFKWRKERLKTGFNQEGLKENTTQECWKRKGTGIVWFW